MKEITLEELLKAGAHFGHHVSRWHPKMREYIFTSRGGVYIINLEETVRALRAAQEFVRRIVADGGTILFVGTKRQAQPIVEAVATQVSMPYVAERWVGGTFTNFQTIMKMTKRLVGLKEERAQGGFEKYTKKEQLSLHKEIENLKRVIGGIERMTKLPNAVFIIDVKHEKTAVREAQKMRIPIVALVDTNVSPEGVSYPVPANDDSTKSIQLFTGAIGEAVEEGLREQKERIAQAPAEHIAADTQVPSSIPEADLAINSSAHTLEVS